MTFWRSIFFKMLKPQELAMNIFKIMILSIVLSGCSPNHSSRIDDFLSTQKPIHDRDTSEQQQVAVHSDNFIPIDPPQKNTVQMSSLPSISTETTIPDESQPFILKTPTSEVSTNLEPVPDINQNRSDSKIPNKTSAW